jgi:hypothetical protein
MSEELSVDLSRMAESLRAIAVLAMDGAGDRLMFG